MKDSNKGHSGTILEHGPAKYKFTDDVDASVNYYVKLNTSKGERTLWGVGIKDALEKAGATQGDSVTLTRTGKEAVEVAAPVLDQNGKKIGLEMIDADRNLWKATKLEPSEKYMLASGASDKKQFFNNPKDAAQAFHEADPQERPRVIFSKTPGRASLIADTEGRGNPGDKPGDMVWTKTVGEGTEFSKAFTAISTTQKNTIAYGGEQHEHKPSPQQDSKFNDSKQEPKNDPVKPLIQLTDTPNQNQQDNPRKTQTEESKKPIFDKDGYDLPSGLKSKYAVDSGKFFTKDSASHVFQDHGKQLATVHDDPRVVADMIAVAKSKGWTQLKLTGSEEFRRQAYLQSESQGISTKGYKPSDADKEIMERMKADRSTNKITSGDQHQHKDSPAPRPSTDDVARAQRENRKDLTSEFDGKQINSQKEGDSWKTSTNSPTATQSDKPQTSTAKIPPSTNTPHHKVDASVYDVLNDKDKSRLDAARLITSDALRNLPKDKHDAAMEKFEKRMSQHVIDTGKLPAKIPKPLTTKPQELQQKHEHTHKPSRSISR